MGMLDILKGAYLASGAVDKTLPVKAGETVARGSILVIKNGEFCLCAATDKTSKLVPYVALVPSDKVAGMAGSLGPQQLPSSSVGETGALPVGSLGISRTGTTLTAGQAVVTAVPLNIDGEFRCSEFAGTPAVGAFLTFGDNGKLAAAVSGDTICGKVTKASSKVYQNNKMVSDYLQGGPVDVIEFASYFVPVLTF